MKYLYLKIIAYNHLIHQKFLLLIFFLVTTTIIQEKVLKVKLPPWSDATITTGMNAPILDVKINESGALMVEKEVTANDLLKQAVKSFIYKPFTDQGEEMPFGTAVISLQHDKHIKYKTYLNVYDQIQLAYAEIHQEEALKKFGLEWKDLEKGQRNEILTLVPVKISEALPL